MPKRACDGCSIRKIRCEGIQPCRACLKAGLSCTFLKALRKGGPRKPHQKTINQIHKTQIEFSQLAGGLAQQPSAQHAPPTSNPMATNPGSHLSGYHDDSGGSVGDGPSSPGFGISVPSTPNRRGSFERQQQARRDAFDDGYDTDEFDMHPSGASTTSSGVASRFRPQFPISVLAVYLEIFHHRLYPTWPIIKHKELLAQLKARPLDPEIYTLAITMACATMEQLQLPPWKHQLTPEDFDGTVRPPVDNGDILVSSDRFAAEALKLRRQFGFAERPSAMSVLMGLFLHVYFENKKKPVTATLYLREAVSYIQILRLDRESSYAGMDDKEENENRRLFWLLFITERGHTMVHDMPFVLRNSISMPDFDPSQEPLLVGFMNLVQLFASFDQSVIDAWISGDQYACSRDLLEDMQRKLSAVSPDESAINETQKTDILITKHWMRTLVWQVAMSHGFLSSSGNQEESMNMGFPAEVAGDLLGLLGTVRKENVECHGPGMELKLFEVTNSLADVILCVPHMKPSANSSIPPTNPFPTHSGNPFSNMNYYTGTMRFGPRDYLKGLFDLMVNFRGGNPTLINIIKNKASQLLVNEPGCDRFLELPDREGRGGSPRNNSTASTGVLPNLNRGYSKTGAPPVVNGMSDIISGVAVSDGAAALDGFAIDTDDDDAGALHIPEFGGEYTWSHEINTPSPKFSDNSRSDASSPFPGFSGLDVSPDPRAVGNSPPAVVIAEDIAVVTAGPGASIVSPSGSQDVLLDGTGVEWSGSVADEIMADVNSVVEAEWAADSLNTGVSSRAAVTTWIKDVE